MESSYSYSYQPNLQVQAPDSLHSLSQPGMVTQSRSSSRVEYGSPRVIVHEHRSRPLRSPSPQATRIPETKFIYNLGQPLPPMPAPRVVSYSPAPLPQPTVIVNQAIHTDMVPRVQYDKCVTECRNWQQRYNELYAQFVRGRDGGEELYAVENRRLKERVRELEAGYDKVSTNMEAVITTLVNKYRDSTLKECMLLTDRYRLEKKIHQR